jgi:hypothetical protein
MCLILPAWPYASSPILRPIDTLNNANIKLDDSPNPSICKETKSVYVKTTCFFPKSGLFPVGVELEEDP